MYLYRDFATANVYTFWAHGPLGTAILGVEFRALLLVGIIGLISKP